MSHTVTGPAILSIGDRIARVDLTITHPGYGTLGAWSFEVDGFQELFFSGEQVAVAMLRWDQPAWVGKAMATAAQERADGGWRTTFMGNGPLDEIDESSVNPAG